MKRRFFFHYNKFNHGMTVHWKNQCIPVDDISCEVPVETKWNNSQPRLVLRGWAEEVEVQSVDGRKIAFIK
jgi:hypothetical protein